MGELSDLQQRITAALCGAAGARSATEPGLAPDPVGDMFAVAEAIAARGVLDVDDLRHLSDAAGTALLLRVVPIGLATPLDRPRLRRAAYRCASAAGADEGTTLVCVATALVAADLCRFDPSTTAIRVRQSLLEDAPMALLNRLTILESQADVEAGAGDPGAVLQAALSVLDWTASAGVSSALARLGEAGRGDTGSLAAALAGAACGVSDVPVDAATAERAGRAAAAIADAAGAVA
jgi:hypothetical protein